MADGGLNQNSTWTFVLGVLGILGLPVLAQKIWEHIFGHRKTSAEAGLIEAQAAKTRAETPSPEALAVKSLTEAIEALAKVSAEREAAATARDAAAERRYSELRTESERTRTEMRREIRCLEDKVDDIRPILEDVNTFLVAFKRSCSECPDKPPIPPDLPDRLKMALDEQCKACPVYTKGQG